MFIGDLPYSEAYPPDYEVVQEAACRFQVAPYTKDGRAPAALGKASEERQILVEAYRGMRKSFGDVLFFSRPKRAVSFVFRSEREFLQRYDERFAWVVHFYQSATRKGDASPERYAGLLFIRPWHIHVREALEEPAYQKAVSEGKLRSTDPLKVSPEDLCVAVDEKDVVAPAICEGYVRPPVSVLRSPFFSQCLDFYAKPYGVVPFVSIPFFASHFGAACGHCCAATAFMLSKSKTVLSPYELAVAAAAVPDGSGGDSLVEVPKLIANKLPHIAAKYYHMRAEVECFFREQRGTTDPLSPSREREFSEVLANYLYQGIPVLYLVDPLKLYAPDNDDALATKKEVNYYTPEEKYHQILIHGLCRGGPGNPDSFLFSDTSDLHARGGIFHRVSCKRLWAARLRPDPDKLPAAGIDEGFLRDQHKDAAVYVVCLPREFEKAYGTLSTEVIIRRVGASTRAAGVRARPASLPKITLRDRSQLRGFAIQRILQGNPQGGATSAGDKEKIRQFREELRLLDMPRYLWIEENEIDSGGETGVEGNIHDTRLRSECVEGHYNSLDREIIVKGYRDLQLPKECTLRL